ncbi:hypothetical protein FKW77_006338 [Venturia effusa]|uniref:DUF2278 domain-containing protein n=1 Tax=Venturia effusa TaxID=50376 RepID=A0A517L5I1_9PEZI|nr:hypothetical protein FKW77_006338 [Venturia effusa]
MGRVQNYGVWVAKPISFTAETEEQDSKSPHIILKFKNSLVQGFKREFTAAINVKSVGEESRLVYWLITENLPQDLISNLKQFDPGFHLLEQGVGLDYWRDPLPVLEEGMILDHDIDGPDNDILDKVVPILEEAIKHQATVYIFGSQFPSRDGIHDVHMNQGSLPRFDNGVGQDGAIFFEFSDGHWAALYLAFASQKLGTDDGTGLPLPGARELKAIVIGS